MSLKQMTPFGIRLFLMLLFLGFLVPNYSAFSETADINTVTSLGLNGYDPVSYFPESDGKVMRGNSYYSYTYNGTVYKSSSEANLDSFKIDPERYLPKYDGWCATSMASGKKISSRPTLFDVENGKLYLFSKLTAQLAWNSKKDELISRADENWKKMQIGEKSST